MPALRNAIRVEAGSYEPRYWVFTDPDSGTPIDLTVGYTVTGVVSTNSDGTGTRLLTLTDADFRRTNTGRVYYEPSSTTSAAWTFVRGFCQLKLHHPSGETVRFAEGPFHKDPELA